MWTARSILRARSSALSGRWSQASRNQCKALGASPVGQQCLAMSSAGVSEDQEVSMNRTREAFRDIVTSRVSARRYSEREIDAEIIREIMSLTQSAPSSFNMQPWSVVLARDQPTRERLATAMLGPNSKKVLAAPMTAVFCADLEPSKRIHRMAQLSREAGMTKADDAQVAMAMKFFAGEGLVGNALKGAVTSIASVMQPAPEVSAAEAWSFKNTALAVQTYILACTAYGLATGPMEGFDARRVRATLDIPDRYSIPMVVCTGYPAAPEPDDKKQGDGVVVKRWRYPAEEVVFDGKFGVGMTGIDPVFP